MDRSKTRVRKTKKGRSGGLLNNLQSEGRERRRRRAEDVGVVLGEAARVRICAQPNTKRMLKLLLFNDFRPHASENHLLRPKT